jgi:tripartite-type tricarboxylate transporter receptor subunit TctC
MAISRNLAVLAAAVLAGLGALPAQAQGADPGPFRDGKSLTMLIGFGPGGGYDRWGRTLARYIGRHLPGTPSVISQNMPGAGSYNAANTLFTISPKDGTVMGIIARDAPLGPLTGQKGARFDPLTISWIGTPTTETNVCIARAGAQVKNLEDLKTKELILGETGAGTGTRSYPKALSAILGLKFRLIAGFPSSADVFLAMERGEVDGICESLDSVHGKKPEWIPKKVVNVIFQGGTEINPEIKDIPFILDLAKTEEQKAAIRFLYAGQGIGRPFVAPPGMPPARLKMLRDAFNATMKDPDFIAEVKKQNLDLDPRTGEQLEKLIRDIYATPKPIVEMVGEMIK